MPILKDFTGYELMIPFIEEVKAGCYETCKIKAQIKSNKILQKIFYYLKKDMEISIDEYLLLIAQAFSKEHVKGNLDESRLSSFKKTYEYCSINWSKIKKMVLFLKQNDIEKKIELIARKYLPNNIKPKVTIYFFLNGGDCRAPYKGEIYADIILLTILGKTKAIKLLAHEFHHCCRAEIVVPYKKERCPEIFQVLQWLEMEGIADKVYALGEEIPDNKFKPLLKLINIRRRIYSKAKEYLKLLDRTIQEGGNPVLIFIKDCAYHPVGHFMANVIENALGIEKLVEAVGDPFDFIEKYNESAKRLHKPNVYVFSDKTLNRLRKIREEILRK